MGFNITGDPAADKLLDESPFALVTAMMLDQQFPMERAFAGPAKILERFGTLDPAAIAGAPPEDFSGLCATPPAVHRYPGAMAARIQEVARHVVERYDGRAEALWADAPDGKALLERVGELPGFGAQKAKILVALLGKRYGVTPPGWREAAGEYGEEGSHRSVADITGPESLAEVRRTKQEKKQAAKAAAAS